MKKCIRGIGLTVENVGKVIKSSKKKYTWTLKVDQKPYEIVYTRSKFSGKDRILVNKMERYCKKELMRGEFSHTVAEPGGDTFTVVECADRYKLFVNGKDFDDYFGHDRVKSILKKSRFEEESEAKYLQGANDMYRQRMEVKGAPIDGNPKKKVRFVDGQTGAKARAPEDRTAPPVYQSQEQSGIQETVLPDTVKERDIFSSFVLHEEHSLKSPLLMSVIPTPQLSAPTSQDLNLNQPLTVSSVFNSAIHSHTHQFGELNHNRIDNKHILQNDNGSKIWVDTKPTDLGGSGRLQAKESSPIHYKPFLDLQRPHPQIAPPNHGNHHQESIQHLHNGQTGHSPFAASGQPPARYSFQQQLHPVHTVHRIVQPNGDRSPLSNMASPVYAPRTINRTLDEQPGLRVFPVTPSPSGPSPVSPVDASQYPSNSINNHLSFQPQNYSSHEPRPSPPAPQNPLRALISFK